MGRRRLRLRSSSSDEDEDEDDGDQRPLSNPNPTATPNPDPPLVISDDDFVDVSDVLSGPSPPPPVAEHSDPPEGAAMDGAYASVSPIDEFLRGLGLRLRPDWLASCAAGLAGFQTLDVAGKARMCFEQFLLSDMNHSGAGVLPPGIHAMHTAELEGPFVLQVDEVINICSHLRERYHDAPAGPKRCLKLSLTDGVQRVFGMEYRPIKELEVLAPAGFKIVIRNLNIRRGLLMLVPEVLEVLGGMVESLDAARKRFVDEVNKPPRGKRKHGVLPLSKRASLAAWPSNATNSSAQANSSMPQNSENSRLPAQAATVATTEAGTGETIIEEFGDPHTGRSMTEEPTGQQNEGSIGEVIPSPHIRGSIADEYASANSRPVIGPITGTLSDVEDTNASNAVDARGEVEHPLILSGNKEIPFTYLGCLVAEWTTQKGSAPCIQGKIKCFLTGVKGFQFKQRSTYELQVYVDDGSLISEILIDHNAVHKSIGHSPEEVTAALSSSDKRIVADMRESIKRFQLFLSKFEGIMLVEINKNSPFPVALEMNQGCSTSDAWLLLRRLKFTSPQEYRHNLYRPINLSR